MAQNAIMRPLAGLARAFAAMQSRLYQAPPITIAGVNEQDWPSALQPVQPVGPPGSQPLLWGFWQGINQNITPRPDAELSAGDLRGLATYPLARICIDSVISQVSGLKWTFQLREVPGQSLKERRQKQENDKVIPQLAEFFAYPDGETPWSEWVKPLLDDLLVIDAPSILMQRTLAGKIVKLRVPDGAEILRLIDDQGYTPAPPSPAYTQLWEGIPRILLTTDQLLYRPRNIVRRGTVSSQLYGMSPTEEMATEIKIGMERLRYVLTFYTEGSVPGIVQMVPPGINPDLIKEGMDWMNSEVAGNLAKRRQWRNIQSFSGSVQEGPKDAIHQLKEPILADTWDDKHTREICFGYGTSPQRLMKMIRTEGQSSGEAAQEEGMVTWIAWLKSTLDVIIQRKMGHALYEAIPDTAVELDPSKQMEIDTGYVKSGIYTINERRDMRGSEPRPELEANGLMVITATGAIPLAGSIERTQQQHDADILPKPAPVIAPPGNGAKPEPELEPSKKKVAKAATISPAPHTTALALAKTKLYSHIAHFLFEAGKKASAVKASKKIRKADKPDDETIDRLVEAAVVDLPWSDLVDLVEPDLMAASVEGARVGLEQLGIETTVELPTLAPSAGVPVSPVLVSEEAAPSAEVQALISAVNTVARDWAKQRAAEMVGMKRVDGELVENPNAKWRIDLTTRNILQRDITAAFEAETPIADLAATIRDSAAFSQTRADLIATTEVSNAQMNGNAEAWLQNGNVQEFKWQLSADHVCCDICDIFAMNSPHPVAKVKELLRQKHPNCECAIIATKIKGVEL